MQTTLQQNPLMNTMRWVLASVIELWVRTLSQLTAHREGLPVLMWFVDLISVVWHRARSNVPHNPGDVEAYVREGANKYWVGHSH